MKIFIYKTAIVTITFAILFEIIIGSRISDINNQINELTSNQNKEKIISKIREEIKRGNQKEYYLDPDDRAMLSTFLNKIIKELQLEK